MYTLYRIEGLKQILALFYINGTFKSAIKLPQKSFSQLARTLILIGLSHIGFCNRVCCQTSRSKAEVESSDILQQQYY